MARVMLFLQQTLLAVLVVVAFAAASTPAFAQTPPPPGQQQTKSGSGWTFSWFGDDEEGEAEDKSAGYYVSKLANCWSCEVFKVFGNIVFADGQQVSRAVTPHLEKALAAFAILFSLVYLGGGILVGDPTDLASRWKVFWKLMLSVGAASVMLGGQGAFANMWEYVYGPLLSIPGMVAAGVGDNVSGVNLPPAACAGQALSIPGDLSGGVLGEMYKTVCGGHQMSMYGIGMGFAMMGEGSIFTGSLFTSLICGAIMCIVFFWISLSFALRLIDALLRLTLVGFLSPFLVVCAVFKQTRSYVQVAISNVLYSGFLFAFTFIMFKLGVKVMAAVYTSVGYGADPAAAYDLASADVSTTNALVLLGAAMTIGSMLRMAPSLAQEFSGFRGSTSGAGDGAVAAMSAITTTPIKLGAMAASGGLAAKAGGAAAGKAMAAKMSMKGD